ncbi:MAG: VCBS repeat-containing protein, partial [Verrucomicrobia bacterium]|nr:VCBS repeat-containing protein [Verrucomicrobiota bacterium]
FSGVVDAATVQALYDNHAPKTWPVNSIGEAGIPFTTPSVLVSTHVYDAEQDTLSVASFTQPAHGTISHNGNGSFTYTATGGYIGTDLFTATITDGRGGFTENTVNVRTTGPALPGSENRTITFTDFQTINAGGVPIALDAWRVPRAIDWDTDGDQDMLIGHDTGIWRYNNTGTSTNPVFAAGVRVQAAGVDIALSGHITIALADMTGDGVDDLVVGDGSKTLRVYRNTSAAGQVPVYAAASPIPSTAGGTFVFSNQRFDAADWNGDGLVDIVTGCRSGELMAYRNVGTATSPLFDPADYEVIDSGSYNLFPRVFDLSLNGVPDYIRGHNLGSIKFSFDPSRSEGLGEVNGTLTVTHTGGVDVNMQALTDGAIVDFADFNADGVLDILIGGHAKTNMHIAYGVANTVADSIAAIEAIYDAHPTGLGAALEANDQKLLNQIKDAERNIILQMQSGTSSECLGMFAQMVAHVGKYTFLQMGAPVDPVEYDNLPGIAGQNLMTMHHMLPDTPEHRGNVADAVGLAGLHREIYLQMGLHLGDNQQASQGMLESVRDFMALQPRESFPDGSITLHQYYGNGRDGHVSSFRGSKNTFNFGIGNSSMEWKWADDLNAAIQDFYGAEVQRGDYFTFVMGHEVTHSLDGYVQGRANADLWRRKGQVLNLAAGPDVLSSNGGGNDFVDWTVIKAHFKDQGYWDGTNATWDAAWDAYWATGPGAPFRDLSFMRWTIKSFLGMPQEAMATQANQHWAHAEARLVGAIDRFQRGTAQGIEPMKANVTEVLTFLDWISCGMNKIVMQDTLGTYSPYPHALFNTTHAWIERDGNGYITKLTTSGRTFEFVVDEFGIVTGVLDPDAPIVTLISPTEGSVFPNPSDIGIAAIVIPNGNAIGKVQFFNGSELLGEDTTAPFSLIWSNVSSGNYTLTAQAVYDGSSVMSSLPVNISVQAPPGVASAPVPLDGATNAAFNVQLGWAAGSMATSHDVYFGTNSTPAFQGNQSGATFDPGTLLNDTTYYWAVDEVNVSGTTAGPAWSFTTARNAISINFGRGSGETFAGGELIGPLSSDSTHWNAGTGAAGSLTGLVDNAGAATGVDAVWQCNNTWENNDGTADDEHRLSSGYLDDKNLSVTISNIPYASYKVYGLFATDQNQGGGGSCGMMNFDVNGTWVLGGDASTTAAAWGTINANNSNHGEYWTEIDPGVVQGNYWTVVSSGATCTIVGENRSDGSSNRGCLTGVVIEKLQDTPGTDTDGDGMPDDWENAHSLNPLVDDKAGNPDLDAYNNWQEYVTDTDPQDGNSKQTFSVELAPGTGLPTVRFRTSASRRYAVEYRVDLSTGAWLELGPSFSGNGTEMTVSDSAIGPRRYYRLRIELP